MLKDEPTVTPDTLRAYRTRLDVAWQPATAGEATALFRRHGLEGEFWSLV